MSATVTEFCAIRYCTTTGVEHVIPKLDRVSCAVKVGNLLYTALKKGEKLSYVRIVSCRRRPGTKVLFEMSRKTMDEEQLRRWCKFFHQKAIEAVM